MKRKIIMALAVLLTIGQGAWADGNVSFPRHYDEVTNPEDGSADHPYQIQDISDLNALAADVNSGTTYKGYYFTLMSDLDYSGETKDESGSNYTPIGYGDDEDEDGKTFSGIFLGNKHTISGIVVNKPEDIGVGLFGYISKATIKDLTLEDCTFSAFYVVGAIAGSSSGISNEVEPIIENCHVASSVKVQSSDKGNDYVGGIIGYSNDNITIRNCTSEAKVTGDEFVGGIAGCLEVSDVYHPTLENTFYTGSSSQPVIGEVYKDGLHDGEKVGVTVVKVSLPNADDAPLVFYNYTGYDVDLTLSDRTLYKDGSWNTLCLPFSLTAEQVTAQLAPSALMTLKSSSFADGTLTLTFETASAIEAGKPYMVKWSEGSNGVNPTFTDVTLENVTSESGKSVSTDYVEFVGTCSPFTLAANDRSKLYLGADNTLYYPNASMTLGSCRAFFQLKNGIEAGDKSTDARNFVLDFDGIATAISDVPQKAAAATGWWTLDGRRLNGKPAREGMYINNGRKVLITE